MYYLNIINIKNNNFMKNEQEGRLKMFFTEVLFCEANERVITNLPGFATNLAKLKSTSIQIQAIGEQQRAVKTGITKGKNQLKAALAGLAADDARKLTAYAKLTNNQTLLAEVNFSLSDFKRFSDTALKDYAQIIYNRGQDNIAALGDYGITAATQTTLLGAINSFNAALSTPRFGITQKSQATKQLATLFEEGNAALAGMDTAVEIIRLSHPVFYKGYKTARKVVGMGIGSLSVKGLITDAQTGDPLKGVTICFSPNGNDEAVKAAGGAGKAEVVLTKKSAMKGGFNVKSLPEGVYSVTISKNGYQEKVTKVVVTKGEMGDLSVGLSKD